MSVPENVVRDERTVAVENAIHRVAFVFVLFALLIDAACRSFFFHEAAWDLLALAFVPGFVCMIYQHRQKALNWPSRKVMLFRLAGVIFVAIIAAGIAVIMLKT